jgi:ubiquinone/menaquinone biosynthesis C-methylase UbiE
MNWVERLEIRSQLRTRRLTKRVFPTFEHIAPRESLRGATVLEVGCGPGRGAEYALRSGATSVLALDADPRMVRVATRRLKPWAEHARVAVGDATDTGLPDASVDVAIELQVLHHVVDWQAAVAELSRVLRPGGTLLFEDSTRDGLSGTWSRVVLEHPSDNRFSAEEFAASLSQAGFAVDGIEDIVPGSWFAGVAHRTTRAEEATH